IVGLSKADFCGASAAPSKRAPSRQSEMARNILSFIVIDGTWRQEACPLWGELCRSLTRPARHGPLDLSEEAKDVFATEFKGGPGGFLWGREERAGLGRGPHALRRRDSSRRSA